MSTVTAVLAARAEDSPDGLAFTFGGRSWTYREVWEEAGRAAGRLQQAGVGPGDHVLIVLPNGPAFFAAFYGTLRAGGVAVPVFPGLGAAQVAAAAHRSDARLIVREADLDAAVPVVAPGSWQDETPSTAIVEVAADAIAYIQYTSGSTGESGGVMMSHRNLLTNIDQIVAGMAMSPADRFVSWLPTYHDLGLIIMTMVPFTLGAELHLLPTSLRDGGVAGWLRTIAETQATVTAAPDFAYRLALRRVHEDVDLSTMRLAINGAEPVRAATIAGCEQRFRLAGAMATAYGLAEATVCVTAWPPGTTPAVDERGFVSAGPPIPDVRIQIAPDGEVLVASTANAVGYYADPVATAETFGDDGYVRTGDLGYLGDDGTLYIVGRKKEIIIAGGRNLAPQEIVQIVDDRPQVRIAAAVGIDRAGLEGEQAHVFAEVRDTGDLSELAVDIAAGIWSGLGMRPARVHLLAPGTIPLTPNGKIRHGALREAFLAGTLPVLYPA